MERRIADIEYEQMLLSRYAIAQHRADDGLDRSAYLLLSRIHTQGPMSISELSEAFRLDISTVQRQTTAATRESLLERIPDPDGGIARKFTVTTHGVARLRAVRERSTRALDQILGDWSSEEIALFADMLHRFNLDIEGYREAR
ncbi:DNA-binding MarR family transcriptional regulator [Microbacterium halimionae]|uniref:DNA-binding MarR family transcriptional regulator n=1 Tax=Microbacterium halimionae TaxID=1526413 RepID=A0A7W3PMQ1_9MICO|nr:MarR family transcriptional regulator [Microbacterium halimionae]MBA8817154.1 DNA-binding MarR family transcriptional regulator [Microbacterium halimionae]NII94604.1 DNA-binding MarR family transcriptional regulator [Microbacterium halimionae]